MEDWLLLDGDITSFPPGPKHVRQFIRAVREQGCAGKPCEAHEKHGTKLVASLSPGPCQCGDRESLEFAGLCSRTGGQTASKPALESITWYTSQESWSSGTAEKLHLGKTKLVSEGRYPQPRVMSHVQGETKSVFFHESGSLNWKKWAKRQVRHKYVGLVDYQSPVVWISGSAASSDVLLAAKNYISSLVPSSGSCLWGLYRFSTSCSSFGIRAFAFNICTKATGWSLMYEEPRPSQGTTFTDFVGHALGFLRNTAGIPAFAGYSHTSPVWTLCQFS